MPMCQAYGCSNKPGGSGGEKRSFFAIPNPETDRERCARWLVNIGTDKYDIKTYKYCKNRVVCEEHFEAECFKEDMCAKVLGYKTTKKMLKPDAVPTIFVHRPRASQRETSRQRQERSERKEVLNTLLLDAAGQSTATLNQQTTNDPHDADESDFMDAAHVDVPEPCEFATVVTKSTEKRKLTTVDDMVRRKKRRRRQSGRNNGNIVDSSTQTTLPFCITSVSSLQHEVEYFDASTQFPEPDALPPHHESDHDTYGAPLPDHPAQIHLDLNAILQEEIQQQERKTETEQQEREEETEQQEREEEIKSASSVSQPLSEGRTIPTSPIFITPASVRQPESPEDWPSESETAEGGDAAVPLEDPKSEKVQDKSPVSSNDHTYARVEAAVSRDDQAVSRDDHTVSRDEPTVYRNNHAVVKDEPEVSRDEQAFSCTGNEQVSVPASINRARTSIADDPAGCDFVPLSMEVETTPTTEESHRVLPLSTLVQNTSCNQENLEQMSRLKRLNKRPGRPQKQGIAPIKQIPVDADVYSRWCSMARQLGVTPCNLAPILLDAMMWSRNSTDQALTVHLILTYASPLKLGSFLRLSRTEVRGLLQCRLKKSQWIRSHDRKPGPEAGLLGGLAWP